MNRRIKILCRATMKKTSGILNRGGCKRSFSPNLSGDSIVSRVLTDFGVPADDLSGKISRLKIEHGINKT
jgi:hypothetical protein